MTERLIELVEQDEREMAITLAQGIRKGDNIRDITVDVDNQTILVETEHFRGIHEIVTVKHGGETELDIKGDGEYSLKTSRVDFRFTFGALSDETKDEMQFKLSGEYPPEENSVVAPDGGYAVNSDKKDESENNERGESNQSQSNMNYTDKILSLRELIK